jgi:hypothetical protein
MGPRGEPGNIEGWDVQTGRNRRRLVAGVATLTLALSAVGPVYATDLHQTTPIAWDDPNYLSDCSNAPPDTGQVLWHFILSQPESPSTTLTAVFQDAGVVASAPILVTPSALQWELTTGRDTLLAASTDSNGSTLNLSFICVGADVPAGGETPTGSDVPVTPAFEGGTSPIEVNFATVSGSGVTTLTTTQTAPELPAGFELGDPATFYDLTTTATYSGLITVCLDYTGVTPAPTALLHYEGGAWMDITTTNDPGTQTICGETTSLSPFAAVHPTPPTFVGFFQPLNDPISASNPMSVFKGGSTIPVRFALNGVNGSRISDADAADLVAACALRISLTRTAGSAPPVDEAVVSTTPNTGTCFRYDAATDQFVFNLGTRDLAKPATYTITATLYSPDSVILASHSVAIGLR